MDANLHAELFDRLYGYAELSEDRDAHELALGDVYGWYVGTDDRPAQSVCNQGHSLVTEALIDNARAGLHVVSDSPEAEHADVWTDDEREAAEALLAALCGPEQYGFKRAPEYVRPVGVTAAMRIADEVARGVY